MASEVPGQDQSAGKSKSTSTLRRTLWFEHWLPTLRTHIEMMVLRGDIFATGTLSS